MNFLEHLENQLNDIKEQGLFKEERIITSSQQPNIKVNYEHDVINLCANNYLGLANSPLLIDTAKHAMDTHGFGMASVRFICGTQDLHKKLESKISDFLQTDDTILYSSCFDANGGLFETLLTKEDAIISDELNHASIIDGVRLCKAARYRYKNNNMADLESKLIEADANGARYKLIATDGVFSMDGYIADLKAICDLADKYYALVMVDDSHAVGFIGEKGRGTPEYCDVLGRIDIITGTLGKALGGASGGYTSGRKQIIDILRQKSRPNLFSNSIAPAIAAASIKAIEMVQNSPIKLQRLKVNAEYFRKEMTENNFNLLPGDHPIIPVMIYDAAKAVRISELLMERGIYAIAFSYPVVPHGQARIRVQISAAHTKDDLQRAVCAFVEARKIVEDREYELV
ncbi:MAG: glycine C-acetyltransferase [Lentisphaerales bacterium]|nr:glycine C-acetyltransferase [Lentisphaerales bacterium]